MTETALQMAMRHVTSGRRIVEGQKALIAELRRDGHELPAARAEDLLKTAESGSKRAHAFCPGCGTPIYAAAPEPNPSTYGLRVGGIDQRAQLAPPARQIWCRSALPWSMDLTGIERIERQ